jgi:hypothetical protein
MPVATFIPGDCVSLRWVNSGRFLKFSIGDTRYKMLHVFNFDSLRSDMPFAQNSNQTLSIFSEQTYSYNNVWITF